MADSLAQQKKKLRAMLAQLKKKYGVTKLIHHEPNLDLCVYLILREGWDFRKATKAVNHLMDQYIDWNEVRVSYFRELTESLASFKFKAMDEKIERFVSMLQCVFNEYNRLQMELLYEKEFDETCKVFESIEPLGVANANVFLQCLQNALDETPTNTPKTLVMSPVGMRMGIRLGLIKKTGSLNVGRKEFTKLLDPKEFFDFQNHFVRHAERVCFSKNPLCKECVLSKDCAFFKS